eukprot:2339896-Pleurochrysis_carterae.AAC.1
MAAATLWQRPSQASVRRAARMSPVQSARQSVLAGQQSTSIIVRYLMRNSSRISQIVASAKDELATHTYGIQLSLTW